MNPSQYAQVARWLYGMGVSWWRSQTFWKADGGKFRRAFIITLANGERIYSINQFNSWRESLL